MRRIANKAASRGRTAELTKGTSDLEAGLQFGRRIAEMAWPVQPLRFALTDFLFRQRIKVPRHGQVSAAGHLITRCLGVGEAAGGVRSKSTGSLQEEHLKSE